MLMLTPGPVQTRPETRTAASADFAPWDDGFRAIYARLRERLLAVAGGEAATHAVLPLQGSGHFVVEAALRSCVPPAGRVLVPLSGTYSRRILRLGRASGHDMVELSSPDTRPVPPDAIARALAADPAITHVAMVQSETGSGVVNDVAAAGDVVRAAGRRLILDCVSAFGALPFPIAEHPECDVLVFTSGKCLEGLPGLACAVARADRLRAPGQAGSWCLDLADVHAHAQRSGPGSFRFTPPAQVVVALDAALDLFDAEGGRAARLRRYAENARLLHEGVAALGMTPYLDAAHQGPIIVTIHAPADPRWSLPGFVEALRARGVLISNFHTTEAPTLRIGCIGAIGAEGMRYAVEAIRSSLDALGIRQRGAA